MSLRKRRQDRFGRGKTVLALVKSAVRCLRARHVATVNVGTWETLEELLRMTKHGTKNDKFKASGMLHKGVRLPHSSAETSVMEVERRGQQSSRHALKFYPINNGGTGRQWLWKRKPSPSPMAEAQSKVTGGFLPCDQYLLLNNEETPYGETFGELDGSNAVRVGKTRANGDVAMSKIRVRTLRGRVREIRMHGSARVLLFNPFWVEE